MEKKKLLIVVVILVAVLALSFGIYYNYFQFNQKDVRDYISEEVTLHPPEEQLAVQKIISDGVRDILDDKYELSQVITTAKKNGTPREMELVHAAIMSAKQKGYIN